MQFPWKNASVEKQLCLKQCAVARDRIGVSCLKSENK